MAAAVAARAGASLPKILAVPVLATLAAAFMTYLYQDYICDKQWLGVVIGALAGLAVGFLLNPFGGWSSLVVGALNRVYRDFCND